MMISMKWLLVIFFTILYLYLMIRSMRDSRDHALSCMLEISGWTISYLAGWVFWLITYYVL